MRRRILTAALTTAAIFATALVGASTPAQAADGRAVSPEGELRAFYLHGLNRAPDAGGLNTYLGIANADCRAGVLRFSYDILTSPEAARFLWAPDRQTNAVFMALLNRAPDPSGWATYLAMNRAEGIDRSTVDIMKSPEYQSRLNAICAGRRSSNVSVYDQDDTARVIQNMLDAVAVGSITCGLNYAVKKMKKLRGRAGLAGIAAMSGEIAAKGAGLGEMCKLTKQVALAAAWAAYISSRNHPVYIKETVWVTSKFKIKTTHYTWQIGWTPSDTREFSGKVTTGL